MGELSAEISGVSAGTFEIIPAAKGREMRFKTAMLWRCLVTLFMCLLSLFSPALATAEGGTLRFTLLMPYSESRDSIGVEVSMDSEEVDGLYGDLFFRKGRAAFSLSEGDVMDAVGLPAGMKYSVAAVETGPWLVIPYRPDGYPMNTRSFVVPQDGETGGVLFSAVAVSEVPALELRARLPLFAIETEDDSSVRFVGVEGTAADGMILSTEEMGDALVLSPFKVRATAFSRYGEAGERLYAFRTEGAEEPIEVRFSVVLDKGASLSPEDDSYVVDAEIAEGDRTLAYSDWNGTGFCEFAFSEENGRYASNAAGGKATLSLAADFQMIGREAKTGEFTWLLTEDGQTIGRAKNDKNGKIIFPSIAYSKADVGQHVYKIEQDSKDLPDVTLDDREYYVGVLVTNRDGEIAATVTDMTRNGKKVSRLYFENKYALTDFKIYSLWQGGDEGKLEFILYANGEKMRPQPEVSVDGSVYYYTDLPMFDSKGRKILYTARELYVDSYLAMYINAGDYEAYTRMIYNGGTVVNRRVEDLSFRVQYRGFSGRKEPEYSFTLYNEDVLYYRNTQPVKDEYGRLVYRHLPYKVRGQQASYSVKLDPIPGHVISYENTGEYAGIRDKVFDNGLIIVKAVPSTGSMNTKRIAGWLLTLIGSLGLTVCTLPQLGGRQNKRERKR